MFRFLKTKFDTIKNKTKDQMAPAQRKRSAKPADISRIRHVKTKQTRPLNPHDKGIDKETSQGL